MKDMMEIIVIKPIKRLMKKFSIPVFYAGPFPYRYEWNQKFISQDISLFSLWDHPTQCLAMLSKYSEYRQHHSSQFFKYLLLLISTNYLNKFFLYLIESVEKAKFKSYNKTQESVIICQQNFIILLQQSLHLEQRKEWNQVEQK